MEIVRNKLIYLAMFLMMTVSLCACGDDATEEQTTSGSAVETENSCTSEPVKKENDKDLHNPQIGQDGITTWDCIYFGDYWQSDEKGKKKEPIKWRVLSVNGNTALLLSDKILDSYVYMDKSYDTWESSELRTWLNKKFIKKAFDKKERSAIITRDVDSDGIQTKDKISLLTQMENEAKYGFNTEACWIAETTDYARNKLGRTTVLDKYKDNGIWWLIDAQKVVSYDGEKISGQGVLNKSYGIRPILSLDISDKKIWKKADQIFSESIETEHFSSKKIEKLELDNSGWGSVALMKDGSLYTWGKGSLVGDGTTNQRVEPKKILENIVSVSIHDDRGAAVTEKGELYIWGFWGQKKPLYTPKKFMDGVKKVSLGENHAGIINKNNDLYMWGDNFRFQLGNGTRKSEEKPVKIMSNVKDVCLGREVSAALKKNNSLYMWGEGSDGKIIGKESFARPVKIMNHVVSVSVGGVQVGVIKEDRCAYVWGAKSDGVFKPSKIMEDVKEISMGGCHGSLLKTDGSLWTWGTWNRYGELGNGEGEYQTKKEWKRELFPQKILEQVKTMDMGGRFSGAVGQDGYLYMWGDNSSSNFGIEDYVMEKADRPIKIDNLL